LELDSTNEEVYFELGVVYLKVKKLAIAVEYFKKALQINPQYL
jgi:tetratricopeptide (TPR) repeat protein